MCNKLYVYFIICLASLPTYRSVSRTSLFRCRFGSNSSWGFRCELDSECLSIKHLCDEIADCADEIDEAFCSYPKTRQKRQNSCAVPPHPPNGIYEVANVVSAKPGQSFESLVLSVRCRLGYGVVDSDSEKVYCINGRWFQKLPKCTRFCKLEPHPSVRYRCLGPLGYTACGTYVAAGSTVVPSCNSPIYYSPETLQAMTCVHGSWDHVATCRAECGRITPEAWALVIGGRSAKRGELPWHVGIYQKTSTSHQLICGGSLILNNIVISAAHCFWDDVQQQLPASGFAVAIGKLYKEWDHERDFDAQKSDVKQIRLPPLFQGHQANLQQDIAVLILSTPFTYKPHIRPVCHNYDNTFNRLQLQQGKLGKVAGWGMKTESGNPAGILQVVDMPYISDDVCVNTLPASFREYITGDKFCAGYTNGTALCRGDSGGGLTFPAYELGIERFYLRGIASASPRSDDLQTCNDETYTAFTKVIDHEDFIKESILASLKTICPYYLFQCSDGSCADQGADCNGVQECADGSDEAEELCQFTTNTTFASIQKGECVLPSYPDNGQYVVEGNSGAQPGQALSQWTILVNCNKQYAIEKAPGKIQKNPVKISCKNGEWVGSMPKCERYCKLNQDPSVVYTCSVGGTQYKECESKVISGTTVVPVCKAQYYDPLRGKNYMRCIDGVWDKLVKCNPDCGRVEPQVLEGETVARGELPWHVGVYQKHNGNHVQICGGSIVTNDVVISAAHCFWNDMKKLLPVADYAIAAEKLHRAWNHEADGSAQKSDVKEIKIPNVFRGVSTNFQGDIAVVKLATPFVYNDFVKPICLNFDVNFNRKLMKDGTLGKTGGWGLASANGSPSDVLKVLKLPYVSFDNCITRMPPSFHDYLTADKFCAGYTDGTAFLCRGDTGSALAVPVVDQDVERYYIIGVPSTAPVHDDLCNTHTLTAFTEVLKHEHLIRESLANITY